MSMMGGYDSKAHGAQKRSSSPQVGTMRCTSIIDLPPNPLVHLRNTYSRSSCVARASRMFSL